MKVKEKKAISLIVLVITILILSILAAAVIVTLSNNNIIDRASGAVEEHGAQTEKEAVIFAVTGSISKNNGQVKIEDIQEALAEANVKAEGEKIAVEFNNSNKKYVIDKSGDVTVKAVGGAWKVTADGKFILEKDGNTTTLALGDKVRYNPESDKGVELSYTSLESKNGYQDQTFTVSEYKGNWYVFGEEEGNLILISDVITPDNATHYGLYGLTGYINSEEEFQNIANIYGQGVNAILARCITLKDINNITNYPIENHNAGLMYAYGNVVTYEKVEAGVKRYWTKSDGTLEEGYSQNNYFIKNRELKVLSEIGEKLEIINNYCSYDITKYASDENQKYIDLILGHGNYWLDYRYERALYDYVIYGHLIVSDTTKEVDRNYSMFSTNWEEGPESVSAGYYSYAGVRVLVYVDYAEPVI